MSGSDGSTGILHRTIRVAGSLASSIRTTIVLPYAVLTLTVASVGTFLVTQLVAGSLEERFINQLVDSGQVASDSVVRKEREHLEVLRAMAFTQGVDVAVASGDMHTLEELLVPLAVKRQTDSVEVTDNLGRELFGFRHDKGSTDARDYTLAADTDLSTWFIVAQILAGQVDQLGDKFVMLVKEEPSGYYLFYTGGPIRYEGQVVGAVLVGTYLDEFLAEIKQETLADVTFYDGQGQVLATTFRGGGEQVKDILEVTPAFCQSVVARPDETFHRSLTLYGRPYGIVFGPLRIRESLLGIFSVALSSNFVIQKAATSRLQFGLLFTLAMVLVFVIGYLTSRRIIVPIIRLVQVSRAVAAGDLNQQTGIRRGDEIGILASSFDQMTHSLRERTRELEEEASKIRAIVESIADGVIVEDKRGRIIMMNPAAEKMLGSMSEGFPIHPIKELTVLPKGEPSAAYSSEDRRFEAGGKVISAHEAPVVTKDEIELGKVMVLRDITREVAERNRRVKAETLTAIGDMMGIMAHRMNNILGAARANLLNIARKRGRGELASEFVEESLQQVMESIDKALGMLKTLSRPFRSDKELEEVDVNSCLSSALKRLTIPEGIQIIGGYTDDLPTVLATREYLIEVFGNLIANAVEAIGDTGRLGLHSQLANNWIEVSITDTGPGIPEELQEKIFELGSSFKKTGEGLGFGLWWSRTFLERLGGSLHVESQVGAGSKFVVRLPAGVKRESE